ncbi:chemotaxis protein [Selenomonas sp. oral taxon 126]|uniref:methyl-accepting chemotaxis protein n=1 Tax=Selenomonas sp. oral taxon 126 TaxID=712528 RepID=UPI000807750F|nr:methyl-accepting chemotaxis protein [Selenomonas sp. oral taxon 126]ANR70432.1 chemotaxis protein [Selenomonas sp. oral taxon 126]
MNGLTVSKKIILSFAILIALFLGFGAYACYSARVLNQAAIDLSGWTSTLGVASDLSDAANIVRRRAVMAALTKDPAQREKSERDLAEAKKAVDDAFTAYEQALSTIVYTSADGAQKDREILENERKAWQAYLDSGKGLEPLIAAGDMDGILAYAQGPTRDAYRSFTKLVMEDQARSIQGAKQAEAESNAAYTQVLTTTIIVAIIVVLFTCACAIYLLRNIKTSVDMVLMSLRKVAQGDLSIHLPADSGDEFGQMADECNKMLTNIRTMTKTIQKTAESVADSSTTLTSTSEQSAQATQNVAQSITEVAEAAQTQMDSVAEAKHQVHAFTRGLTDVTETIENVGTDIAHTSQKAEEGNKLVEATVAQMNTIADTVISSSNVVAKLGERSKEIGNIVEVISGISGQTNLLALNAAIEAARAGEHGHGFAVVAEEVRKLAEESQQASKQIGDLIRAIQEETEQAVAAMQTGRSEAEKGRENVTATGEGFSEIRAMIDRLQQYSVTIGTTMEDLTRRAAKIDDATGKIHDSASKVAAESQNVSAATEQQAAGMEEIAASSRGLSDMAHDLNAAAAKFKT